MVAQCVLGGRYLLHEVLGRGGMATVWRGRDLRLQRAVAVKVLDTGVVVEAGVRERLAREARALARLAHPNIVGVHDFDVVDGTAYLVMELVEGPSLAVVLAGGPLPVRQAVGIAIGVCDALIAAHGAGVLHRDVKPGNLLIVAGGGVKVCDFGLARPRAAVAPAGTAKVEGTSEYLAPERVDGQAGDARGDLYALGCVVYAMLTGAPPFTGTEPAGVLRQQLYSLPPPLGHVRADIPAELARLVLDLLAKNPADRPATAEAVRDRLVRLADNPADRPASAESVRDRLAGLAENPDPRHDKAAGTQVMTRHHHRTWRPAPPGSSLRWALAACAALVLLGAAFAVVPAIGSSPSTVSAAAPSGRPSTPDGAASTPAGAGTPAPSAPPQPSTPPASSALPTSQPSPARPVPPADQVTALQATVTQLVDTGQLDPRAAGELRSTLTDIARRLDKGQTGQAASRAAQLRDRLTGLAQDGKLSASAFQLLAAGIDRLTGSLTT